jgi:DNA-binding response OmpR family regulator
MHAARSGVVLRFSPEIVLADMALPDMDAADLSRLLRAFSVEAA